MRHKTTTPLSAFWKICLKILFKKTVFQLWDYGVFWRRRGGQTVRAGSGEHFSGGAGRAESGLFPKISKKNAEILTRAKAPRFALWGL